MSKIFANPIFLWRLSFTSWSRTQRLRIFPGLFTPLSNTLRSAKDPNCARMLSYWAHFLSQVRHSKLIHLRRFERELFLDVILISQSPENRCRLRSTRRRDAPIYKISRTEITHWAASPFEDCLHFIKTGTYNKNLVSFCLLTRSNRRVKLRWRARVNWPWGQLAVVWGEITSK